MKKIEGKIVDIIKRRIFNGRLLIENGKIVKIEEISKEQKHFIIPGFVNSHIHIESTMLTPARYSEIATAHGTIAAVCDPHEIANVLGVAGVRFMIENAKQVPMKMFFGAPSCVPATPFETSGAVLDVSSIDELLQDDDIYFLAEMMNFPGVINENPDVISKLQLARKYGKPIDGHAPHLANQALRKYIWAGITTDHECTTIEEAEEKINLGMKILIREGSAAKDFDNLWKLIDKYPGKVMLCTDDSHPDDLINGHINILIRKAVKNGANIFNVLQAASLNPVKHYRLPVGLLQTGDNADFIVVDNLNDFTVEEVYVNGNKIFSENKITYSIPKIDNFPNNFNASEITKNDLAIKAEGKKARVIIAKDKTLLTDYEIIEVKQENGFVQTDTANDVLKIIVLNRYNIEAKPSIALIKGFGLKNSAIATSVAHDSHNIIAAGTDDNLIVKAVNKIIENKGGMIFVSNDEEEMLKLPVAGLMDDISADEIAEKYIKINEKAIKYGSKLKAPFMTLSFMALLVIPKLKIGDKGLFDVEKFEFTQLLI